MKVPAFLLLLVVIPAAAQSPRVGVDPRVELMSILFRLAGNTEYNQCRVPAYDAAITRWFEPFKNHEAVHMARSLRGHDGVGFDAVMSMAVNVTDIATLAERIPFDAAESRLEKRWHGVKARAFLKAARRFVSDSHFQQFLDAQSALYASSGEALRTLVDKEVDIAWFERFLGARADTRFFVVLGMANGGGSYGPSIRASDGIEESYLVVGAWQVDGAGHPRFDKSMIPTIVHEGAHSYANPAIQKVESQIDSGGTKLFEAVRKKMQRQAYSNGPTVLAESLVRACTARYVLAHDGVEAARQEIESQRRRGFIWTGELFDVLGQYERDRSRYPTLDSFMPRVVAYFNDLSPRVAAMEAATPKVLSMTPANGAKDVDPAVSKIVIRFDRPMKRDRFSVIKSQLELWPEVVKSGFDETGTAFTLDVRLKPGRDYEFSLNSDEGGNFVSAEGTTLDAVLVHFHTK